jgi:hypothetical protein
MRFLTPILALLSALILIAFAALQLNDPDPWIWVGFYSICALVPLLLLFGRFAHSVFWISMAFCTLEIVIAAPGAFNYLLHSAQEPLMQAMNPDKPYIEEAREFLGAFIALLLVCLCGFRAHQQRLTSHGVSSR